MTARSSDPQTAKDAGTRATTPAKLRASHALILNVFVAYGDTHDKDLIERVHQVEKNLGVRKLMSPSGIRSRRSEMSKPNMDRLAEIARDLSGVAVGAPEAHHGLAAQLPLFTDALARLRVEGFRSKLIDTGKRATVDGRSVIVWGIAS